MKLAGLLNAALDDPACARVRDLKAALVEDHVEITAPQALRPFLLGLLAGHSDQDDPDAVLAVTATSREAEELALALGCLIDPDTVVVYPSWETLPHERLSPRSDTVGRRLAVLRRLAHPEEHGGRLRVVVAPVRAVLQPQLRGLGDLDSVFLATGHRADLSEVVEELTYLAYSRVDLVTKRGEFAVRGGILDVFPPTDEHPARVEFWGDEVEDVRSFSVADQRALEPMEKVVAGPCRELLLTPRVRARAAHLSSDHPQLAEMLNKLAEGIPVEGMESLAPVLLSPGDVDPQHGRAQADDGDLELFIQCMPAQTHLVLCDPERIRTRAHDLVRTSEEFLAASWAAAAVGGQAPIDLNKASFRTLADLRVVAHHSGQRWWSISPFGDGIAQSLPGRESTLVDVVDDAIAVAVPARPAPLYHSDTERLVGDLRHLADGEWRIVLVFSGPGPAQRAAKVLADAEVAVVVADRIVQPPQPGIVTITTGGLGNGFLDDTGRLAVLTGADISGGRGAAVTREMRKMPSRRRNQIDPLELRAGDFVVHEAHGIGKYVEMVRRGVNGADREYLVIEYAASKRGQPGDRLFVPTDCLDQLSRYVGGETPTVHRLGGSDWQKSKARARKAVREIAAQLIQLYAARHSAQGYACGPDTTWQRELEDAFPYVETPDQLATIDEVKRDMMKSTPMDRLICGDVGYGKTEIGVRAAFKAVTEGRQVAVLVPTTLLAQQHYNTFTERMAQFPVTVRQLSRFTTPTDSKKTVEGIVNGTVDIVIGTHRLLQQSTRFHKLGLVIVDEEQRFGVEHKEYLKQLRASVDVLTMSATPIPRTLEMAITGIREMSTIATPPEERHPVLTYVGVQDDRQITAAIHRELLRDGQVFYLHNRVESIESAARQLRDLVPEARIAVAHGQMGEDALEKVMVAYWEKQFDVLVCTTIVESGIDIPNANTLIVERADLLGLAQLHQIRGRVGRGRERAYAYFLYPPHKPLTEHAHERLATIAQHTELGAGMYVAMKDLEIRGAGNLLGGEQSGHIEGVGFDLYIRMVGEAVSAFKNASGEETAGDPDPTEVKVDLPVDAHVPHEYVSVERLRLEMYRKIASGKDSTALDEVVAELRDRYGQPPAQVMNLIAVARFRLVARSYGLSDVCLQGRYIRFAPLVLLDSKQLRLKRLYPDAVYKPSAEMISVPRPMTRRVAGEPLRDGELLDWCERLLTTLLNGKV